MNNAFWSH